MPEIRHVRSVLLKSMKLGQKSTRLDKISQAILPNIDWKKLSVDPSMADKSTKACINKLNTELNDFRNSISEQLEHILCSMSATIKNNAWAAASSPEIFQSAATMAQKYHDRGNKSAKPPSAKKAKASSPVSPNDNCFIHPSYSSQVQKFFSELQSRMFGSSSILSTSKLILLLYNCIIQFYFYVFE